MKRSFSLLSLALLPLTGALAQEPVGWNYVGPSGESLASDDSAGAPGFGQANWNNHAGNGQGVGDLPLENLVDAGGSPTSLDVTGWTLSTANSWRHGQAATPDERLLNDFANREASLTFADIPFAAQGYGVVVYYGNNEGPTTSTLTVGPVSRTITTGDTAQSSIALAGYLEGTGENAATPTNYAVFRGYNDESLTVSMTGAGNNGISAIQFIPETAADPPATPGSPVPANDSPIPVSVDQALQWSESQRADEYQVFLRPAADPEPTSPTAVVTSNQFDPPADLQPSTQYRWKVVARNLTSNLSASSATWTFFTANPGPPAAATPLTPGDASERVSPSVTFTWEPAAAASSYRFFLWAADSSKPPNATAVVTGTTFQPADLLEPGTEYRWTVESQNGFGSTEASQEFWAFSTLDRPGSPPGDPDPIDNSSGLPTIIELAWSDVPNAGSYEVRLWSSEQSRPAEALAVVSASSYRIVEELIPESVYLWEVVARNSLGSETGPQWRFTTGARDEAASSVGWNFTGDGSGDLDPDAVAGAPGFAQAHWNNHRGGGAGQSPGDPLVQLVDESGTPTDISVNWSQSSDNSWFHDQTETPDQRLLNNFANREARVTFEDVGYELYDVVVYYGNNEGPSTSDLSANDLLRTITTGNTAQSSLGTAGYLEGTDENSGTPTNYTLFPELSDPTLVVAMVGQNNNGISAIQIIESAIPLIREGDIVEITFDGNNPAITFLSEAGNSYRVERSSDLAGWVDVSGTITAIGESTRYLDSAINVNDEGSARWFYRTVLED